MRIGEHTVDAVFQRYHIENDASAKAGELLTRPGYRGLTEEFFSELAIDQHFELLEWQLLVQERLFQAGEWHVSINLHNGLLAEIAERDRFLELASRFSGPVTFEFTETYPMPPVDASNRLLRSLRELGHMTALDDFGTGLNGMSLLTDYDFDIVKLDRSLTNDLADRVEKTQTIRLVREMLEVLGKEHIVEGIESDDVYRILLELGFTNFQGYLFGGPVPVTDLGVDLGDAR